MMLYIYIYIYVIEGSRMYALEQVTKFLIEERLDVSCRDGLVSRVYVCVYVCMDSVGMASLFNVMCCVLSITIFTPTVSP